MLVACFGAPWDAEACKILRQDLLKMVTFSMHFFISEHAMLTLHTQKLAGFDILWQGCVA
jgi:hypothetical protein